MNSIKHAPITTKESSVGNLVSPAPSKIVAKKRPYCEIAYSSQITSNKSSKSIPNNKHPILAPVTPMVRGKTTATSIATTNTSKSLEKAPLHPISSSLPNGSSAPQLPILSFSDKNSRKPPPCREDSATGVIQAKIQAAVSVAKKSSTTTATTVSNKVSNNRIKQSGSGAHFATPDCRFDANNLAEGILMWANIHIFEADTPRIRLAIVGLERCIFSDVDSRILDFSGVQNRWTCRDFDAYLFVECNPLPSHQIAEGRDAALSERPPTFEEAHTIHFPPLPPKGRVRPCSTFLVREQSSGAENRVNVFAWCDAHCVSRNFSRGLTYVTFADTSRKRIRCAPNALGFAHLPRIIDISSHSVSRVLSRLPLYVKLLCESAKNAEEEPVFPSEANLASRDHDKSRINSGETHGKSQNKVTGDGNEAAKELCNGSLFWHDYYRSKNLAAEIDDDDGGGGCSGGGGGGDGRIDAEKEPALWSLDTAAGMSQEHLAKLIVLLASCIVSDKRRLWACKALANLIKCREDTLKIQTEPVLGTSRILNEKRELALEALSHTFLLRGRPEMHAGLISYDETVSPADLAAFIEFRDLMSWTHSLGSLYPGFMNVSREHAETDTNTIPGAEASLARFQKEYGAIAEAALWMATDMEFSVREGGMLSATVPGGPREEISLSANFADSLALAALVASFPPCFRKLCEKPRQTGEHFKHMERKWMCAFLCNHNVSEEDASLLLYFLQKGTDLDKSGKDWNGDYSKFRADKERGLPRIKNWFKTRRSLPGLGYTCEVLFLDNLCPFMSPNDPLPMDLEDAIQKMPTPVSMCQRACGAQFDREMNFPMFGRSIYSPGYWMKLRNKILTATAAASSTASLLPELVP